MNEVNILQFDGTNIVYDKDSKIRGDKIFSSFCAYLNHSHYKIIKVGKSKKIIHYNNGKREYYIFIHNVTHLGNPNRNSKEDRSYKKRIQLSNFINEFKNEVDNDKIKLMGIYSYNGVDVFVDFEATTYLMRTLNNSSAHVMLNDLYLGYIDGFFSKIDANGNKVNCVSKDNLEKYLSGEMLQSPFDFFDDFNSKFPFGKKLESTEAIETMLKEKSKNWKQAEWSGFYLEHEFEKLLNNSKYKDSIVFHQDKTVDGYDFDLYWKKENVYGDLKASSENTKEAPGNDLQSLNEILEKTNRFWYVIYEHDVEKDSGDYSATKKRNMLIMESDNSERDLYSYKGRMKKSVTFTSMFVIEVNKINFNTVLKNFNQGKQPDGSARKVKVLIDKRYKNDDNFVVYRYNSRRMT